MMSTELQLMPKISTGMGIVGSIQYIAHVVDILRTGIGRYKYTEQKIQE